MDHDEMDHEEMDHDEMAELLGAHALDALEPDEAAAVEAHVARCGRCSSELAAHREVAGLLSADGGEAPGHLWDAIAARLERPEDVSGDHEAPVWVLRPGGGRPGGPGRDGLDSAANPAPAPPSPGYRWRLRAWAGGAVAAAVVVMGVLGVEVDRLSHQVDQLQTATSERALSEASDSAFGDPQAHRIQLAATHTSGRAVAEIAVLPSGQAFLRNRGLPALPGDQTYQLWGEVHGSAISLAVLGDSPQQVMFHVDPGAPVTVFAVTAETAGGVVHSTHVPVAVS
jgi:anti-sigma factor RsiW